MHCNEFIIKVRTPSKWMSRFPTSAAEMNPLPSLSNTLKASRSSSSESESCESRKDICSEGSYIRRLMF